MITLFLFWHILYGVNITSTAMYDMDQCKVALQEAKNVDSHVEGFCISKFANTKTEVVK